MTSDDVLQQILKGQSELNQQLSALRDGTIKGFASIREETKQDISLLRDEMRKGFKKTHERIDKLGKQLAYIEDDAPTREEHNDLVKRVEKVEQVLSS